MIRAGERGFTLVELLVSLAITGAAAALLVAALATGRATVGRMEGGAASGETVAAAQAILRDRIEKLLPDAGDNGTGATPATAGSATRLTFIAPAALNRVGAGMQRYDLALGADRTLDLLSVDARLVAAPAAAWRADPLIGDAVVLDIAYYGPAADGAGRRWQGAWTGRTDPPELVRVRLRFAAGDARTWPDLVVRPAATVSTACALDFNTGACRAS